MGKKYYKDTSPLAMGRKQKGSAANKKQEKEKTGVKDKSQSSASSNVTREERINQKSYGTTTPNTATRQGQNSASERRKNAETNNNLKQNIASQRREERAATADQMRARRTEAQTQKSTGRPSATAREMMEQRRQEAVRQKMGDNSRVSEETSKAANRAVRNTPSLVKKAVQDTAGGHAQTIADVTEMTAEKGSNSYAMKLGIDTSDKEAMKRIRADRKKTADTARAERKRLQAEQEERQESWDRKTKNATELEKAYYGAVESGTGMLTDLALGMGTQAGSLAAMGSRTYGTTRGQAEKEGATQGEDRLYSFAQAMKEVGTELMFPGAGLAKKAYGRAGLSLAEKAANVLTKGIKGRAGDLAGAGLRLAGGVAEENIEEAVGWGLDPLIKEYTYGRNTRHRNAEKVMKQVSDNMMSEIQNEDDVTNAAAYLASPDFLEQTKQSYMEEGMSEKDATSIALKMRDYLAASLSGDIETMTEIEDEVSNQITELGGLKKSSWSRDELRETLLSTTLLTGVTGLPGSVTTAAKGAAIRDVLGKEGVAALARTAVDFEDKALSDRGQVAVDRLAKGGELTSTQIYDLHKGFVEQTKKDADRMNVALGAAQEQMDDNDLVAPYSVDQNGMIHMEESTGRAYDEVSDDAASKIKELLDSDTEGKESLTEDEIDEGARAIAGFKTGVFTISDANALNYSNTTVRTAFVEETGVDLNKFIVKNKNGSVNIPATNAATKEALFTMASDNLVRTAEVETVNWMDHAKGEVVSQVAARMGSKGSVALQQALDDVDERDTSKYRMMANAADMLYQAGRNIGSEWSTVKDEVTKMFRGIPEEKLQMIYEAGLEDRYLATDKAAGLQTKIGEAMSLNGEKVDVTKGRVYIDTEETPKGSVIRVFSEIANSLGVDIHLVDSLDVGETGKQANGQYINGSIYINVNSEAEPNIGYIFMHEVTHHLKMYAPEEFNELENLVREKWFKYDDAQMQNEIAKKIESYGKYGQKLSEEEALEEIIADAAHEFLNDPSFAEQVAEENPSIAKAVLNAVREMLRKLRQIIAQGHVEDTHMNDLFSQLDILADAERLWLEAFTAASKNKAAVGIVEWDEAVRETEGFVRLSSNAEDLSIKDQIRENTEELSEMDPVADINVNLDGLNPTQKRNNILAEYKKFGYHVDLPEYGRIELGSNEVGNSLGYLRTDAEYAAFFAVPRVLKRGKKIPGHEDHKGRGYSTVSFIAPVILNGTRGNVGVVVKETGKKHYKTHRVLSPDGTVFEFADNEKEVRTHGVSSNNEAQRPLITSSSENITSPEGKGKYSLGYHAGDLGKSTVDDYYNQGYGRGTGHFGFGTYFVGNKDRIKNYNKRNGEPAPIEEVDFDKYNLFRPRNASKGYDLHDALKRIDGFIKEYSDLQYDSSDEDSWDKYYWRTSGINSAYEDVLSDMEWGFEIDEDKKAKVDEFIATTSESDRDKIEEQAEKAYKEAQERSTDEETVRKELRDKYHYLQEWWPDTSSLWANEDDYIEDHIAREIESREEEKNVSLDLWKYRVGQEIVEKNSENYKFRADKVHFLGSDLRMALDFEHSSAEIEGALRETERIVNSYKSGERGLDSAATVFMKLLGYEGVDVRHINELDNTGYGSVIYDLKDEDLARKQEIGTARFSLNEPVEEAGDLIAVHNIWPDDLMQSLDMGGLAMPSIAVIRDEMEHDKYGSISLLFNSDTIDPAVSRNNRIWGGDAYTPTFPTIERKFNEEKGREIEQRLLDILGFEDRLDFANEAKGLYLPQLDEDNLSNKLRHGTSPSTAYERDLTLRLAYLTEKGNAPAVPLMDVHMRNMDEEFWNTLASKISEDDLGRYFNGALDVQERMDEFEPVIRETRKEAKVNSKFYKEHPKLAEKFDEKLGFADVDGYMYDLRRYYNEGGLPQRVDETKLRDALSEKINEEEYKAWVEDLFNGIVEKEGIWNGKDYITASGIRRDWEELHNPVTVQNVVAAMKSGLQSGQGNFGGVVKGASQKEFKSLDEVRENKGRLQKLEQEEYDALMEEAEEKVNDALDAINEHNPTGSSYYIRTKYDIGGYVAEILNKTRKKKAIQKKLLDEYDIEATDEQMDDLMEGIEAIAEIPTGYFEAKPARAILFNEVEAAVVPKIDSSVSDTLKDRLKDNGIKVFEYDSQAEGDRQKVVNKAASALDIRFSISPEMDEEYMKAVESGDMDTAKKLVGEAAKSAGYVIKGWHGTDAKFNSFDSQYIGSDNKLGKGFYFSRNGLKFNYPTEIRAWLKVENPITDSSKDISDKKWDLFCEAIGIAPVYGVNDLDKYTRASDIYKGDNDAFLYEFIRITGKDGIISDDRNSIVVFSPINIKSADAVTYAEDGSVIPLSDRFDPVSDDIRYSLPTEDSDGSILSDGQMEFFKNSMARDNEGRLAVVYHSTGNGGFTIFDPSYSDDKRSIFFTSNYNMSRTYIRGGEDFNAYEFSMPDANNVQSLEDVKSYFDSLFDEKDDYLTIMIFDEEGKEYGNGYWKEGTLEEFIAKYGKDYAEASGQFIDINGTKIGGFSSTAEMISELKEAVEVINKEYIGGERGLSEPGTYACYLNLKDPLIINCNGANWDSILEDSFQKIEIKVTYNGDGFYSIDAYPEREMDIDEIEDIYGDYVADKIREVPKADWENYNLMGYWVEKYTYNGAEFNPEEEGYPSEGNTRFWCNEAEAMGYDGVIFRNLYDTGPNGYGSLMGDVYVAFKSEQIKDIHNENPTENPDIRYSIIDDDEAKSRMAYEDAIDDSYEALERYEKMIGEVDAETYHFRKAFKEEDVTKFYDALTADEAVSFTDPVLEEDRVRMARSKADFYNHVNAKWNDRWTTGGELLDIKSVKKDIRNLVIGVMNNSDTEAKYRTEIVNKTLMDVRTAFQLMKQDQTGLASALLYHSAQRMIDNVEFYVDDTFSMYKDLRDYLRTAKIALGEEYWSDVDYADFRKRNFGRLKLVKGTTNVDQIYQELQEMYPEWFDEDETMTPPDMLLQIEHVLDSVQPYKEAYSSEAAAELCYDIADELYEIMAGGKEYKSLADTYKQRYDDKTKAMKQRHAEAMLRMRKAKEIGVKAERAKWQAREEQRKERTAHKSAFRDIQVNYDWLKDRLLTNTKDKNIPEQYKKDLAGLLAAFDLQTVGSKNLEAKTGRKSQKTIKMAAIRVGLEKMHDKYDTFYLHDAITDLIDDLAKTVEGKTIDELNVAELGKIDSLLKALKHEFINYEKVRVNGKKRETSVIGHAQVDSALDHAEKFGAGKDYQNSPMWLDKIINLDEMTPAYMFRRVDPSGTGISLMWKEIRRSFDRYVRNMDDLTKWMEEIVGEYHEKGILWNKYGAGELSNWRSSNYTKAFNLTNGVVELTPAQMMSVYCLSKRAQAYQHMVGAGVVVAPVSFQAKIMSDLKKKANTALPTQLTDADIKTIVKELTPDQVKVADKLQELMATKMADWGNEASMDVLGIKLFNERDYFPIKSDKAALTKDLNDQEFADAIRNFGFAKAVLPGARNAIMIEDIFDVVTEHCNNMNLYNAYSAAMNDFMKVYNYRDFREDGSEYTVQQAVAHGYSRKATTFIMTFMRDLNGNVSGRASGIESMYNGLLANAKKASVFANLRVAAQQPTAITRAFAEIDPKYLKGIRIERGAMDEMFEHCPIALWKSWGYYDINMGKSIEDVMMNNGKWLEDKATDMYGKLDNITWTAIWQMVKAEMKDTHPDVKTDTDEYWALCNERMSDIVDFTQVVDSPMHRSHGMRNKDFFHKMTTAFMAEPTLTFNMVRDGYVRAMEEYKLGHKANATKIMSKTIGVFLLQAATVASAAAIIDALRGKNGGDGDDDESKIKRLLELWWINALENFKDELNPLDKIYVLKDIGSLFEGWENRNLALQGIQMFSLGWRQLLGDPYARSSKSWYENMMGGIGYMTGIPIKTMMTGVSNFMKILGIVDPRLEALKENLDSIPKEKKGTEINDSSFMGKLLNLTSTGNLSGNLTEEQQKDVDKKYAEDKKIRDDEALAKLDEKCKKKAIGLSGEELDDALWEILSEGYTTRLDDADLDYIEHLELIYMNNGGDTERFRAKIKERVDASYKKTFKENMTEEDIDKQYAMKVYMQDLGFTDTEISDIVYHTDARKDLQAAMRLGNEQYISEEATMLIRAGLTEADYEKAYKNRNRMKLDSYKGKYKDNFKSTGTYIWPTQGTITSRFGYRDAPTAGASSYHQAIDIGAPMGTQVVAADGGVVIEAGPHGGYGNSVGIKHDDGTISYYNHLSSWCVKEGDTVGQGQQIAQVGSTGVSTGPHLDFRLYKDGEYLDPEIYLSKKS